LASIARQGMVTCPRWGFSTLSRWTQQDRRKPEKPAAQSDLEREVARLRKENRLLREERDILGPVLIYLAPPVSVIFRQRQAILRRQGGPFSSRINAAMAENGEIPKGRGAFWQAIRVFRLPINQIAASKHPDCLPKWARAGGAR